jgi:hypothetical protein
LTIFEKLGNIGSEVDRAIRAARRGDSAAWRAATWRALDLFDATVETEKSPARLKEILRAREQFLNLLDKNNLADAKGLEKYFTEFAVAARSAR